MKRRRFLKAALGVVGAALLPVPVPKTVLGPVSWWKAGETVPETFTVTGTLPPLVTGWSVAEFMYEPGDEIVIHRGDWPEGAQFDDD